MTHQLFIATFALSLLLVASACTGRASCLRDCGDFDSGLAEDRPASTLSQAEAVQLCNATIAYMSGAREDPELARGLCVLSVLTASPAGTPAECEAQVASCLEALARPTTYDCSATPPLSSCSATVGDFEVCASDWVVFGGELGQGLSCSLAGMPELPALLEERRRVPPASCTLGSESECAIQFVGAL